MKTNKLLLPILIILLVCASCSSNQAAEAQYQQRVFVALGDSVATGFGIPLGERYTSVFYEALMEQGIVNEYVNYAVNGYTTTRLLNLLNNMDESDYTNFTNAEVVTINIGGNNILVPFLANMPSMDGIIGSILETVRFITDSREILNDAIETFSELRGVVENFSILDIMRINSLITNAGNLFDNVSDVVENVPDFSFMELFAVLSGNFSDELTMELERGVERFAVELAEILTWVENAAPNATVILNTIYNPIPAQFLGMTLSIRDVASLLTNRMNTAIIDEAVNRGHLVADVSTRFENETNILELMNFNFDTAMFVLNLDIVHPNAVGHGHIADLCYEVYITALSARP
jgi:lysophospholipase L1-like esterase